VTHEIHSSRSPPTSWSARRKTLKMLTAITTAPIFGGFTIYDFDRLRRV
jgi:hypothetical protein